jgi:hypothetical protein
MQGITIEIGFFKHRRSIICFYSPITYKNTIDQNLNWNDFKSVDAFITSSPKLEAYAIETYTNLSKFLVFWDKFWKFKFIPIVGTKGTIPTCWRLGPGGFKTGGLKTQ